MSYDPAINPFMKCVDQKYHKKKQNAFTKKDQQNTQNHANLQITQPVNLNIFKNHTQIQPQPIKKEEQRSSNNPGQTNKERDPSFSQSQNDQNNSSQTNVISQSQIKPIQTNTLPQIQNRPSQINQAQHPLFSQSQNNATQENMAQGEKEPNQKTQQINPFYGMNQNDPSQKRNVFSFLNQNKPNQAIQEKGPVIAPSQNMKSQAIQEKSPVFSSSQPIQEKGPIFASSQNKPTQAIQEIIPTNKSPQNIFGRKNLVKVAENHSSQQVNPNVTSRLNFYNTNTQILQDVEVDLNNERVLSPIIDSGRDQNRNSQTKAQEQDQNKPVSPDMMIDNSQVDERMLQSPVATKKSYHTQPHQNRNIFKTQNQQRPLSTIIQETESGVQNQPMEQKSNAFDIFPITPNDSKQNVVKNNGQNASQTIGNASQIIKTSPQIFGNSSQNDNNASQIFNNASQNQNDNNASQILSNPFQNNNNASQILSNPSQNNNNASQILSNPFQNNNNASQILSNPFQNNNKASQISNNESQISNNASQSQKNTILKNNNQTSFNPQPQPQAPSQPLFKQKLNHQIRITIENTVKVQRLTSTEEQQIQSQNRQIPPQEIKKFKNQFQQSQKNFSQIHKTLQKIDISTTYTFLNRNQSLILNERQKNRFLSGILFFSKNYTNDHDIPIDQIRKVFTSSFPQTKNILDQICTNFHINGLCGIFVLLCTLSQKGLVKAEQIIQQFRDLNKNKFQFPKITSIQLTEYLHTLLKQKIEFIKMLTNNLQYNKYNRTKLEKAVGKQHLQKIVKEVINHQHYTNYWLKYLQEDKHQNIFDDAFNKAKEKPSNDNSKLIPTKESISLLNLTFQSIIQMLKQYYAFHTQQEMQNLDKSAFESANDFLISINKIYSGLKTRGFIGTEKLRNELGAMFLPMILKPKKQNQPSLEQINNLPDCWLYLIKYFDQQNFSADYKMQEKKLIIMIKHINALQEIKPNPHLVRNLNKLIKRLKNQKFLQDFKSNQQQFHRLEFLSFYILFAVFGKIGFEDHGTVIQKDLSSQFINQEKQFSMKLKKEELSLHQSMLTCQQQFDDLIETFINRESTNNLVLLFLFKHWRKEQLGNENQKKSQKNDSQRLILKDELIILFLNCIFKKTSIQGYFLLCQSKFLQNLFGSQYTFEEIWKDQMFIHCLEPILSINRDSKSENLKNMLNFKAYFFAMFEIILEKFYIDISSQQLKRYQKLEKFIDMLLKLTLQKQTAIKMMQNHKISISQKMKNTMTQKARQQMLIQHMLSESFRKFMNNFIKNLQGQIYKKESNLLLRIREIFKKIQKIIGPDKTKLTDQIKIKQSLQKESVEFQFKIISQIYCHYNQQYLKYLQKTSASNIEDQLSIFLGYFEQSLESQLFTLEGEYPNDNPNQFRQQNTMIRIMIGLKKVKQLKSNNTYQIYVKKDVSERNLLISRKLLRIFNLMMKKIIIPSIRECDYYLFTDEIFTELFGFLFQIDRVILQPLSLKQEIYRNVARAISPLRIFQFDTISQSHIRHDYKLIGQHEIRRQYSFPQITLQMNDRERYNQHSLSNIILRIDQNPYFESFRLLLKFDNIVKNSRHSCYRKLFIQKEQTLNSQSQQDSSQQPSTLHISTFCYEKQIINPLIELILYHQTLHSLKTNSKLTILMNNQIMSERKTKFQQEYFQNNPHSPNWSYFLAFLEKDTKRVMSKYIKTKFNKKLINFKLKNKGIYQKQSGLVEDSMFLTGFQILHFAGLVENYETTLSQRCITYEGSHLIQLNNRTLTQLQKQSCLVSHELTQLYKVICKINKAYVSGFRLKSIDLHQHKHRHNFTSYITDFCDTFANSFFVFSGLAKVDLYSPSPLSLSSSSQSSQIKNNNQQQMMQDLGFDLAFEYEIVNGIMILLGHNPSFVQLKAITKYLLLIVGITNKLQYLPNQPNYQNIQGGDKKQPVTKYDLTLKMTEIKIILFKLYQVVNMKYKSKQVKFQEERKLYLGMFLHLVPFIKESIQQEIQPQILNHLSQQQIFGSLADLLVMDNMETSKKLLRFLFMGKYSNQNQNEENQNESSQTAVDHFLEQQCLDLILTQSQKFFTQFKSSYSDPIQNKQHLHHLSTNNNKPHYHQTSLIMPQIASQLSSYIRIFTKIFLNLAQNKNQTTFNRRVFQQRFIQMLNCIQLIHQHLQEFIQRQVLPSVEILAQFEKYLQLYQQVQKFKKAFHTVSNKIQPTQFQKAQHKKSIFFDSYLYFKNIFNKNLNNNSSSLLKQTEQYLRQKDTSDCNRYRDLLEMNEVVAYCAYSIKLKMQKQNQQEFQAAWNIYKTAMGYLDCVNFFVKDGHLIGFTVLQKFLSSLDEFLTNNESGRIAIEKKLISKLQFLLTFIDEWDGCVYDCIQQIETFQLIFIKALTLITRILHKIIRRFYFTAHLKGQTNQQQISSQQTTVMQFCTFVMFRILCSQPLQFINQCSGERNFKLGQFQLHIVYTQILTLIQTITKQYPFTEVIFTTALKQFDFFNKVSMQRYRLMKDRHISRPQEVFQKSIWKLNQHRSLLVILINNLLRPVQSLFKFATLPEVNNTKTYDQNSIQAQLLNQKMKLIVPRRMRKMMQLATTTANQEINFYYYFYLLSTLNLTQKFLNCVVSFGPLLYRLLVQHITEKHYEHILFLVKTFYHSFLDLKLYKNKNIEQNMIKKIHQIEKISQYFLEKIHMFKYKEIDMKIQLHHLIFQGKNFANCKSIKQASQSILGNLNYLRNIHQVEGSMHLFGCLHKTLDFLMEELNVRVEQGHHTKNLRPQNARSKRLI